jgi:hypothetical protein
MAADKDIFDFDTVKQILIYVGEGLLALVSMILLYVFGRYRKQHEEMYEWHKTNNNEKVKALLKQIDDKEREDNQKYQKDLAQLKHDFSELQTSLRPILKRMAEEEDILEKVKELLQDLKK